MNHPGFVGRQQHDQRTQADAFGAPGTVARKTVEEGTVFERVNWTALVTEPCFVGYFQHLQPVLVELAELAGPAPRAHASRGAV